jgi:hypothetical protein
MSETLNVSPTVILLKIDEVEISFYTHHRPVPRLTPEIRARHRVEVRGTNCEVRRMKTEVKSHVSDGAPKTTAQSLGSLLKSARDIMRKDKGLNDDLDRLPMLTCIMFLKFLDDLELQRAEEAKLAGKKFKAAIKAPYRWRDWAANPQGVTGDELLTFINNEEKCCPMVREARASFVICASSPVPIATIGAT